MVKGDLSTIVQLFPLNSLTVQVIKKIQI